MIVTQTNRDFLISFQFNPRVLEEVKSIPGRWYDGRNKMWHAPLTEADAVNALKSKYTLESKYSAPQIIQAIPELPELTIDIPLKGPMFPYQAKGVAYSLEHKKLINGDQPGLGKTLQSIATVHGASLHGQVTFPCLVICPATLKENWVREWAKWTNRKTLIMSDSIKNTWPQYLKTGLVEVMIVNYESLKKYFVQEIKREMGSNGKPAPLTLRHIHFKEHISLFRSVIIDELHKCLPYESKILTNVGWLDIGFIVENNLTSLHVASYNSSTNKVTFKRILNVWKNELSGRSFNRLEHERGYFYATGNHEVYTSAGKKDLYEIKSGENLLALSPTFFNKKEWPFNSQVLLKVLRIKGNKRRSSNKGKNGQKQKEGSSDKAMCMVWRNLFSNRYSVERRQEILHPELFCKMESKTTGNDCAKSNRRKKSSVEGESGRKNEGSCTSKKAFRQDEVEQSNDGSSYSRKSSKIAKRQDIPFKGRKWPINKTTVDALGETNTPGNSTGVSHKNSGSKSPFQECSILLQSRHRNRRNKIGDRSGWSKPWNQEVEVFRPTKNGDIECIRVESNQVYEPTNPEQFGYRSFIDQIVYDIDVEDNHNYFADGILISNCKDSTTLQAKLVKGITVNKEWVLGLTGTPVVNKPKDLIAQLAIVQRLVDIGGYQFFIKRYCGGDGRGASNLKELHYKLATTCFYQRQKKDVLQDLPDKMRNIVLCDITTRIEYKQAEDNLKEYLLKWKNKTDAEAEKSLRGEIMVLMGIQKNISARGKMNEVMEHIDEIVEAGEKVVVFIHQKEIATALLNHYPKAVSVRGDDDMDSRQRSVDHFQNDPRTQVIICSIKAAGVGITLTASSRVAFVELPWHAADCDQCEDRTHRIGQKNAVQVSYFLGKNTIDEYIYELIESKRGVANDITGTVDNIQREIIDRLADSLFNTNEKAA